MSPYCRIHEKPRVSVYLHPLRTAIASECVCVYVHVSAVVDMIVANRTEYDSGMSFSNMPNIHG